MTICIGAISEKNKTVAITDKMLTLGGPVRTKYEINANNKVVELTTNAIALFAGDVVQANEVLKKSRELLGATNSQSVSDVTSKVVEAYKDYWAMLLEENVLKRYKLTLDIFMGNQRALDPDLVRRINELIINHNLDVQIIVMGVDNSPHIYLINSPGVSQCFDSIGYACIGSGSQHATFSMIEAEYAPDFELKNSIYTLLEAKKRAEYDPGVGELCDLVIVNNFNFDENDSDSNHVLHINNNKLNELLQKYNIHKKSLNKSKDKFSDKILLEIEYANN